MLAIVGALPVRRAGGRYSKRFKIGGKNIFESGETNRAFDYVGFIFVDFSAKICSIKVCVS